MHDPVIELAGRPVGPGQPCFVVAEIGINHNGSLTQAQALVDAAVAAGCDAVKFQKRTVEVVYTPEELARPRESPFGTTNGELKRALELDEDAYAALDEHCRRRGIAWFASCWDEGAVDFIARFDPPCWKIASASLTDDHLLAHTRAQGQPVILSTGLSTEAQIRHAVGVLGERELVVLHCTGAYPAPLPLLNLRCIETLRRWFPGCPIGYSGHEVGLASSLAAVALGACVVERHLTLDRAAWGSDQAASVEPQGMARLVKDIRAIEAALGDGAKRVYPEEQPVIAKLRRVDSQGLA